MGILKAIISAAPALIKAIADVVKMRRQRRAAEKAAGLIKRQQAEEYREACRVAAYKAREAAKIRGLNKNKEFRK